MSVKTCKQHANEPIFIYAQCAACEIQRYRNQVDELKAECARSAEREILQLAENEALLREREGKVLCDLELFKTLRDSANTEADEHRQCMATYRPQRQEYLDLVVICCDEIIESAEKGDKP